PTPTPTPMPAPTPMACHLGRCHNCKQYLPKIEPWLLQRQRQLNLMPNMLALEWLPDAEYGSLDV
ncbi:hypothetical protein AWZ03_011742, partial [Drosophila navojoa]